MDTVSIVIMNIFSIKTEELTAKAPIREVPSHLGRRRERSLWPGSGAQSVQ